MKNYYLIAALLFTALTTQAQTFPYYFSAFGEINYVPLTDSISLNQGQVWDDPEYTVPLGFDFDFYDNVISSLFIFDTNTFIGGSLGQSFFMPYPSDIIDIGDTSGVSISEVSYKIEGEEGSKIAKIEWKNVGFYNEVADFGTADNYLSFQVWFYEGSNDIEVRFGPNSISGDGLVHDFGGAWSGIITDLDFGDGDFGEIWYTSGDPESPVIDTIFTVNEVYSALMPLNDDPSNGTLYRFSTTPPANTINQLVDQNIEVVPTLVSDFVNVNTGELDIGNARLMVFDGTGKQVIAQNLNQNRTQLNFSALSAGMYFINISTEQGFTTKKVLKQ